MDTTIRVLMVDDEEQFRATTEKILRRKGFDTVMAGSGEEAIDKLAERPDVVILDIKMPGMDGHLTLREIKRRAPDLPVIMLTGHGGVPSARESLSEGACDYLSKPCDIGLLAAKIEEAYHFGRERVAAEEKRVMGVMVPLKEYTTLPGEATVREAIIELKTTFVARMATSRILETGHRSILVMDARERLEGILAIQDLIALIMPPYLSAAKPSTADSIQYSPLFWSGMFTQLLTNVADTPIRECMSTTLPVIDGKSSLMEAAYMMHAEGARRLVVELSGRVAGVIREQDLFFEMEKILREPKR